MDGNTLRFEYVFFRVNIYYVIKIDTSERYDIEDYEPVGDVVYLSEEKASEVSERLNAVLLAEEQSKHESRVSLYATKYSNYEKAVAAGVEGVSKPYPPKGPYSPGYEYRVVAFPVVE